MLGAMIRKADTFASTRYQILEDSTDFSAIIPDDRTH